MDLLLNGDNDTATNNSGMEPEQVDDERNSNIRITEMEGGPMDAEKDDKHEVLLDATEAVISGTPEDTKCAVNSMMEDALERTINEVAETSLESAAVEGEDLTNESSSRTGKYDWDAPIVKDIVRRVKNHRLSHSKAAEQLSALMDAKVTTIGVRLQVVKMANDEALAKQDRHAASGKSTKSTTDTSSSITASVSPVDINGGNKSPVSCRTRSKTGVLKKAAANSLQCTNEECNMEILDDEQEMNSNGSRKNAGCMDKNYTPSTGTTSHNAAAQNSQMYMPVIISQTPTTTAMTAPITKTAPPPIIRLLDNEGKLTHIAVAENGSYKLYRVNEGNTNSEQLQTVNQTVTVASSTPSMNNSVTVSQNQAGGDGGAMLLVNKSPKIEVPSCSGNYFIESVPAEQTLGALMGIPKFVNPQRYGGCSVYTRTFGPGDTLGTFLCSGVMRSRDEIKEEVKRLIHCIKSQNMSTDDAVKQLLEFAAVNTSGTVLPGGKVNDTDENKQSAVGSSIGYDTSLQRDDAGDGDEAVETYTRLVDEQGNMNIAIAEGDGYRVYRLSKTTRNQELYKCVDCNSLHQMKRDPIAIVTIVDGMLYGNIHPAHHPKCPLQTLSVKECEQNSVSDENEFLQLHEAATDVEEGLWESADGETRRAANVKRPAKQSVRKNQQRNKSPPRKRSPRPVPERTLGMTLRKRKTQTSPGIYDSEVMS